MREWLWEDWFKAPQYPSSKYEAAKIDEIVWRPVKSQSSEVKSDKKQVIEDPWAIQDSHLSKWKQKEIQFLRASKP